MNSKLIEGGFEWHHVLHRRPAYQAFTKEDFIKSIEMALSALPEDEFVEMVIESKTSTIFTPDTPKQQSMDLETFIYWKKHNSPRQPSRQPMMDRRRPAPEITT